MEWVTLTILLLCMPITHWSCVMSPTMWTQARAIATQINNKLYTAQSTNKLLCLGEVNATQSNLLARPPSDQLQSLTLHDCATYDSGVSPLVVEECGGSGLIAHTPHQVVNGVLHTATTGGVADCRLRGHSVLHWKVRDAPRVEAAALLVGVGEGGEALGEVTCDSHQGECWSVVWGGGFVLHTVHIWKCS